MCQSHLSRNVQSIVVHCHEGGRPHGVANILKIGLTRHLQHLGDLGRNVILGHLVPGEVPEDVVSWGEVGMLPAVCVAPVIAKPDVVPCVSQDITQALEIQRELN